MARGNISNLRESGPKVFHKVASSKGQVRCKRSTRGAKNMACMSVWDMSKTYPDMRCGYNKITRLYACAQKGGGGGRGRRRR